VTKLGIASTVICGLMARLRSAIASTFTRPYWPASAGSWRLVFDTHRSSASISVRCPTPVRASASTTHEPTPPMPITATRQPARCATVPVPYSRSTPAKRSSQAGSSACSGMVCSGAADVVIATL